MKIVIDIAVAYLVVGLVFLVAFDLLTKRIRQKFAAAALESRVKMAQTAYVVMGSCVAKVWLGIAVWLFWPVVAWGIVRNSGTEVEGNDE